MIRHPVPLARNLARRLSPRPIFERAALRRRVANRSSVMLFEADWLGLYPFVRPMVRRFAARAGVAVVVVTRETETLPIRRWIDREAAHGSQAPIVVSYEVFGSAGVLPDLLVSCQPFSNVASDLHDIPKIQTLHGMADKRGELFGTRRLADFTHLFSPAPVVTRLAHERLLTGTPDRPPLEIVEVGCPKTDDLLDGTCTRDEVLAGFGLPTGRPSVLYAPTWEKEASLEQQGKDIVAALCELDISLLVKPHPLSMANRKDPFLIERGHGGKDWGRILSRWEARHSNMRWVRDTYANPSMVAADLLVSEGSGIAFEYVLLDRPIVFIATPLVTRQHGSDTLHHRLLACGTVLESLDGLSEEVSLQLERPEASADPRRELVDRLTYNPGRATDTAVEAIDRLL